MEAEVKPLSPLSAAAREMLEAGSRVEAPSAEQSERMARTLAAVFEGAGGALPGAPVPGPRGSAGPSRLWLGGSGKLLLAVGAIAASNGTSFWIGRVSSRAEQAAPHAAAAAAVPALVAPPLPAVLPAPPAPSEPKATLPPRADTEAVVSSAAPTPARAHRAPIPRATGLRADIQRLSLADAQLRAGRASEARRLLAPPVARELQEQAAALRAVAGCELTASKAADAADGDAAERDARAMLERFPDSPYEARVRSACDR